MKFLVVDDSPTIRRIITNALKGLGHSEVVEAGDGVEALSKLQEAPVDFVITDWNMPNMPGLELTQAIRKDGSLDSLPILMVTTRGAKEDVVAALSAKVNNYIVKPFTPDVLKEKIDSILAAI